jgi:glycosyl hydrolase family 42 (putative beta-galactosidase)
MFGIARWYIWSGRNVPYTMGVTFVPDYASYLGVNPEQTMDALINDLHVKHFRLVSYWSDVEPSPGKYDFSQLDWEFQKADAAHAKITLSIGLRQPRWPECHPPSWVNTSAPDSQWQSELEQYMSAVINRYKNNPALQSYQLENEYFLQGFGTCTNFDRTRLVSEFNLVRSLDPNHTIIINRSNNALGTPIGQPTPDTFGISIYRRVWDEGLHTHRYIEYPFPSWYYAFLAGVQKITTGKDMVIDEFQAEPWTPHGQSILSTSLTEQNKSFNAQRFMQSFAYAKGTGMRTVYFWGAEYWYYRLTVLHDPSVWNVAKQNFTNSN